MNRVLIRHIILSLTAAHRSLSLSKVRFALMLFLLMTAGAATAQQTTGQFVIKTGTGNNTHYLSHAGNALGDATAFSPSVLWTSDNTYTQGGANRNYYFKEGNTPHFLGAPTFEPFGELSLSSSLPLGNQLSNPESQYYFYRWDDGLGRGVQYYGVTHEWCDNNHPDGWNSNNECWEVYWVEYNASASKWKLSAESYGITTNGGRFYPVTITEHGIDTTIVMVTVNEVQVPSGLQALEGFEMEYSADPLSTHQVTPTITNNEYRYTIRPAYTTYVFDGGTHNYYDAGTGLGDQGENTPGAVPYGPYSVSTYSWTITGPGAEYLSIDDASSATPTITYRTSNNDGHKTATLTLTVTYSDNSKQSSSATILVKTPCHNPTVLAGQEVVSYVGATVSWAPTAESYLVSWKKTAPDPAATTWSSHAVGDVTSYTITGLEYGSTYEYKVQATSCTTTDPTGPYPTFTTLAEPGLMVTGAIFGGGRMADVGGKTEVVIVNCDSIGAIFGGNDIAGTVLDTIRANHTAGYAGANITLGVDASSPYGYNTTYGTTPNDGKVRVSSVYGGGNGYYAYNGSSFVPATSSYTSETVAVGSSVKAMTQSHQVGDVVWTNDGAAPKTLNFPRITNTAIIATNNLVKVDSIFGGAKNAFLTANSGDGDSIVINGGTVFAVFGGNNWGGGQGYGKHHIEVNSTTTHLAANITNTATTGYGRDFGIRYLFGGGNKVEGSTTDIHIKGGQSDEVFAGGNAADVYKANVMVECSLGADAGDHLTFGNTYTNAIDPSHYTTSGSPAQGTIGENTVFANYGWDGHSGIYNVRSLYGGNNEAEMQRVPNVTLTSGSVGTVYGGGNAGDMMGSASTTINGNTVLYGTHVVLNSNQILTDYIYGGCRMSNVYNSTWVELKEGHVGTVYGGCNISGDVGSTRVNPDAPAIPQTFEDQKVKGATYVQAGAGGSDTDLIVYKNLFAGGNGYYNCPDPNEITNYGIHYGSDSNFDDPDGQYAGYTIPTHNETNVVVTAGTTVKGNVYAGGNLAAVGFDDNTGFYRGYPELVGMASVTMTGGRVEQNVYGGGNMASIFGRNEVRVSGGSIGYDSNDVATGGALYGGNDRAGQVAEKTNRKLPTGYGYTIASDNATPLTEEIKTFVGVSGNPHICTVYGGGNGDYIYGGTNGIPYCGATPSHPIQPFTFVDIHINGGASGGKINTVYGGGNGVTVRGGAIVFMNIVEPEPAQDYTNVDTIFGGNNKGDLEIVADIRLLHGQVGTVYGGCNQGAMMAGSDSNNSGNLKTIGGYENIGSYVRLRNTYDPTDPAGTGGAVSVTAKVKDAVYGGCRMNGVTRNSLVLAEGGNFLNVPLYGGSDISGTVSGWSRVAVTGGTVGNVYGGGNGGYYYKEATNAYGTYYEVYVDDTETVQVADSVPNAPICANSGVDVTGGQVGTSGNGNNRNIFGGGYGQMTSTTDNVVVNFNGATAEIYGDVYGGSALGSVNTLDQGYSTTVNILNGSLHGDIYGGGLGQYIDNAHDSIPAIVNGKVYVNIGSYDSGTGTYSGNATFDNSDVYGCNNLYGSPQDSVFVNIYQTAHTTANSYPSIPNTVVTVPDTLTWLDTINHSLDRYAIRTVYGGGNRAAYTPSLTAQNKRRSSIVHVYQCNSNTVREVFGGGNAADVGTPSVHTDTYVIIDGGRFYHVVGGGNGYSQTNNHSNPSEPNYNPGASINGAANTLVYSGLINEVYGGANILGTVDSINLVMSHSTSCGVPEVYGKVFGCANAADYNRSVTTTIECGVGIIGELYGGSNQANIGTSGENNADVTLNLYGGTHDKVFAGSKGIAAASGVTPVEANIYGNVTLNLYGGTVTHAFGGSDANGNIAGTITVNVIDSVDCHPLDVTNIYGASNLTDYNPDDVTSGVKPVSPVVNVIHIAQDPGIRGNVYGGGNQATVNANPKVNIGYHHASMAQYIPLDAQGDSLYHVPATPRAYVSGNVFGGGNQAAVTGTDTVNIRRSNSYVNNVFGGGNEAGTTNTVVNVIDGKVNSGVYGGCNTSGTVGGNTVVNITGGNIGTDAGNTANVYGGGLGQGTKVKGNVAVNINGESAIIYGDVYGGSAKGLVNCNDAGTAQNNYSKTHVTLSAGTIHGSLYGGGHGLENHAANVYGPVAVNINGGTVTNVFGCNNVKGAPMDSVVLNVTAGTIDSIFGGGNVAAYSAPNDACDYPELNISGGNILYKVVGGGNQADIGTTGASPKPTHPVININGGNICTADTLYGVFGGCNSSGTVYGNITINITGDSTSHHTKIGTEANLARAKRLKKTPVSVHGGGYGESTFTTGNVTVNYGFDNNSFPECRYPKLYGDLYGGSALGHVNDDAYDVTTVNVQNGSFDYLIDTIWITQNPPRYRLDQYGGNIYGGGLGRKADTEHGIAAVAATVNGVVHVNIGAETATDTLGVASLIGCNVFGCNNAYGSPQQNVYVDVYKTAHIVTDSVDYSLISPAPTFAIGKVYGGGNLADYHPDDNSTVTWSKKVHNTIHYCDNTITTVYGGGKTAATDGVVLVVEGGRFEYVFGGGNGQSGPADIGQGGIDYTVCSGHVGWQYAGNDMGGAMAVPPIVQDCDASNTLCGELEVDYYFFGDNLATHYGDLYNIIYCGGGNPMTYKKVFGGSRLATIYGNITLIVKGGTIDQLYGGSQGSPEYPGDVKRFPEMSAIASDFSATMDPNTYSLGPEAFELHKYLYEHPSVAGKGGNIYVLLEGGTLHNVYGGCERIGHVEGDIVVVVDTIPSSCGLSIDYLYGGNMEAEYAPDSIVDNNGIKHPRVSPKVYLKNGHVNYAVYGGSEGDLDNPGTKGLVTSYPLVVVGDTAVVTHPEHQSLIGIETTVGGVPTVYGDLFGGGRSANVIGNPTVILQGKSEVKNNVYGGSQLSDVTGNTEIIIVPHDLPSEQEALLTPPEIPQQPTFTLTFASSPTEGGTVQVTGPNGTVTSGSQIPGATLLNIQATANSGYGFTLWSATNGSITDVHNSGTTFYMGNGEAVITASFAPTHTFNITTNGTGSGTVKAYLYGTEVTSGTLVPEGTALTIVATPAEGSVFNGWSATNGTITNPDNPGVFTMGNGEATLTATFTAP